MSKIEKKYSEAIAEIEAIIANIEQGTVSIDDLTTHIKKATELLQFCKQKLTDVEAELKEPLPTSPQGEEQEK
ncbi:MAG: exodeoxyribonuclease VII small subunit [Bacteroidetes bacterium]|nr:exodeoxyribonuclease VII small subunit [Bacteroidota bacterium]